MHVKDNYLNNTKICSQKIQVNRIKYERKKKQREDAVKMAQKSINCREIKANQKTATHSTFIGFQKPFSVHREKKNSSKKSVNEKWKYIFKNCQRQRK